MIDHIKKIKNLKLSKVPCNRNRKGYYIARSTSNKQSVATAAK